MYYRRVGEFTQEPLTVCGWEVRVLKEKVASLCEDAVVLCLCGSPSHNFGISGVVVLAPHPASTGGWASERAPGYFPPGTLCGVCVDLDERRVPQEGNTVLRVRPQLVQCVYVV